MKFKEDQTDTKLRGGYYTDEDLATFLLKWGLSGEGNRLLEPGCGNGNFLAALEGLNTDGLSRVDAYEIDGDEASVARERASSLDEIQTVVHVDDYIKRSALNLQSPSRFDSVVGNPPFVRYQYLEDDTQKYAKSIFEYYDLDFTRHTNLWVPFVVAALGQLREGGRFGMVLPSELLHVRHASSLRNYLLEQCARLLIIDPKAIWFEETLQGAILLLAEKKRSDEVSEGVSVVKTKDKEFVKKAPAAYFENSDFVNGDHLDQNWMRALLTVDERRALLSAQEKSEVYRFDEIAEVSVGIVTGANNFFLVPDETVNEYNLEKWAHPMFGRSKHVPGVVYDRNVHKNNKEKGYPSNLIWFKEVERKKDLPKIPKNYIEKGEKKDLHERYKCRIREPWFEVPSVYSTKLGMLKRCHHFPRLIYNKIEAFTTDTAYRITSDCCPPQSLAYTFVNSLTALSAEIEGRHYGGGVLELVPSEIQRLLIPKPVGEEKSVYQLDKMVRNDKKGAPLLKTQDKKVLSNIGLSGEEIDALHSGWRRLWNRRQRND
ncbi:Eco57I restriction-modification methylase domain-containing protein [Salinibacter ruber]|uniref:Eco57I restriction-modification methylase domain-containing protein n=1 Tax=Salinibacter ruber TaxID=146919 RepID=UPI000DD6917B|nr:N-6 DNA methylase [Salinibacter ruber]